MTNSKDKGKRYERHIVGRFKDYGIEARRTAQYCGNTGDAADIEGIPGIHAECKHQEKMRMYDWMAQAVRDAEKSGRLPAVFSKQNNRDDLVTMRFDDWMKLYLPTYEEYISEEEFAQYMNPPEGAEDGTEENV